MASLYIFIDESGDFNFSRTGSKYLVLCSYSTTKPHQHTLALQKLRYTILHNGQDLECFHATEDLQDTRNEVYKIIKTSEDAIYDIVYLEKNKTHPAKQSKRELYGLLIGTLLTYIFGRLDKQKYKYEKIVVVMDKLLVKKDQGYVKQIIKSRLKQTGRPFHLYFFQTKSDPNAQVADYGAWGRFVSLERNEQRPVLEIKRLISNDFDIFRNGNKKYY